VLFRSHILELLPAYALNSLEPEEEQQVTDHLGRCGACRAEWMVYQELVNSLAFAVPQRSPSPRLKATLLQAVQSQMTPQPEKPQVAARRSFMSGLKDGLAGLFRPAMAPAWGLISLVLVIVLAAGNLFLWQQLQQRSKPVAETSFLLVHLKGTDAAPNASGLMVITDKGEAGTLVIDSLPALDPTKQYQLWLIRDGKRTSGGVFSVDKDGYGSLWIDAPNPLVDYPSFGITIEPKGGSNGPTGVKVMGGNF
jgi:anti-sigma-K factor RskA